MIALLHGDAPFGWQGFAFAILMTLALLLVVNKLARGVLPKRMRKRMRDARNGRR